MKRPTLEEQQILFDFDGAADPRAQIKILPELHPSHSLAEIIEVLEFYGRKVPQVKPRHRTKKKPFTQAERKQIERLAASGKTYAEVAAELDATYARVQSLCHYYKITCRTVTGPERTARRRDLITKLCQKGKTPAQIAAMLNVYVDTVNHYRRQYGLTKKRLPRENQSRNSPNQETLPVF